MVAAPTYLNDVEGTVANHRLDTEWGLYHSAALMAAMKLTKRSSNVLDLLRGALWE
jgi:hypothetical protein